MISIAITVFNRENTIFRALKSAHQFLANIGNGEIVVVDDSSTDESVRLIEEFIKNHANNKIHYKLVCHDVNKGVCGAKNTAGLSAKGDWILFLDSDDELIPSAARALEKALLSDPSCPLWFFRCKNQNGKTINKIEEPIKIDLNYLINYDDGERLTVIRRDIFHVFHYDEELRGHEGLCNMRIVANIGKAWLRPEIARIYHTDNQDRLSFLTKRRARLILRGYLRMAKEHFFTVDIKSKLKILARCAFYGALSLKK